MDLGLGSETLGGREKSDTICVFGNIYNRTSRAEMSIIEERRTSEVFDQSG